MSRRYVIMSSLALATMGLVATSILLKFRRHRRRQEMRQRLRRRHRQRGQDEAEAAELMLVEDQQQLERATTIIRECRRFNRIVGMDCEWGTGPCLRKSPPSYSKVALLQLDMAYTPCSMSGTCFLFRLSKLSSFPDALQALLEDADVLKVGVAIDEDARRLRSDYGIEVNGFVDLRHWAKILKPSLSRLGLASLSESFISVRLDKNWRLAASNWESDELSVLQMEYAANDAIAGTNVALAMAMEEDIDPQNVVAIAFDHLVMFKDKAFKSDNKGNKKSDNKRSNKRSNNRGNTSHGVKRKEQSQREQLESKINGTNKSAETRLSYSARQSPLYDNARLEAPDGQMLCVCDSKKARWYVQKGIGKLVSETPLTVRLCFEPAGRPEGSAGEYYLSEKNNVCVICGMQECYLRKYIVPHEYRTHFPEVMRDHQSHDVLLTCPNCHAESNSKDLEFRRKLAKECDAPLGSDSDIKLFEDAKLKKVRSAARAIIKDGDKIPLNRLRDLKNLLKEHFQVNEINQDLMKMAANIDPMLANTDYSPHGKKVVQYFEQNEGLLELERRWRLHFLSTMKPRFLPPFWSLDHQRRRLEIRLAEGRIQNGDYNLAVGANNNGDGTTSFESVGEEGHRE